MTRVLSPHHRWFRHLSVLLVGVVSAGLLARTDHVSAFTPANPAPTPTPTASEQRAEQAVQSFFAAYNRRDSGGVLALLPSQARIIDCNYARHRMIDAETTAAVRRWLQIEFAQNDRFAFTQPFVADLAGSTTVVGGFPNRTNVALDPLIARNLVPSPDLGFKIGVDSTGHILFAVLADSRTCFAGTTPSGAKLRKERTLAHAFLAAYNDHDVAGVSRLIAARVYYQDCGMGPGGMAPLTGKPAIEQWLRQRFANGDVFVRPRIVLKGWLSQPQNNPLTIVIQATRTVAIPGSGAGSVELRIVPNADVDRILLWQVWSGCPSA